ncbi:hypothetical protein G0Q06_12975 [Puniceicoccales bacterium CK1056]|uniref:Uncharacterized protein n=1 Tax=Oceanipulchritudo coccoides TaxID=2706888 RepID=A0A6B2M2Y0_9BACT|nr:hypothetical protein [Oceanipulchritudo coccoides]NDV63371.1 hypothetical protein [Oceanipulchritudo coccoides]
MQQHKGMNIDSPISRDRFLDLRKKYHSTLSSCKSFGDGIIEDPIFPLDYEEIEGKAAISTDLLSRIRRDYPQQDWKASTISIIGSSLHNLTREYEYHRDWKEQLAVWTTSAKKVRYLLVGNQQAPEGLRYLKDIAQSGFNLEIFLLKDGKENKIERSEFIKSYSESHFVLFDSPRIMWLEGFHPVGESYALNCRYYSPQVAELHKSVYEVLELKFNRMVALSDNVH